MHSLAGAHSFTYLLCREPNGVISVLDANAPSPQPKRLALKSRKDLITYIGRDRHLRILESHNDAAEKINWHIIDLATGHILASERKLFWHTDECQPGAVHHAARRVYALHNSRTIVIMDAESLQEITRCTVAPRHGKARYESVNVGSLAWSGRGNMLAVSVQTTNSDDTTAAPSWHPKYKVDVYDATSGQCLQSVDFSGPCCHLLWSSRLDLLAVLCSAGSFIDTGFGAIWQSTASIKVVDPVNRETRGELRGPGEISGCHWTPGGDLLIAVFKRNGFEIVDPQTMTPICTAPVEVYERPHPGISWALGRSAGSEQRVLTAYLRGKHALIRCCLIRGEWHAARATIGPAGQFSGGCITPCGTALMVLKEAATGGASVSHWDLRAGQSHTIAPAYLSSGRFWPGHVSGPQMQPEWAPFPSAWPSLYAYVHMPEATPLGNGRFHAGPQALKLVDASKHNVLGSWSLADFSQLVVGNQRIKGSGIEKLHNVQWAPDGKHLAVYCDEYLVWILTFGCP